MKDGIESISIPARVYIYPRLKKKKIMLSSFRITVREMDKINHKNSILLRRIGESDHKKKIKLSGTAARVGTRPDAYL